MLNGKLKINDDKNEFLIIGPSQQLGKVFQILSLCAGLVVIIPKSALKFARAHTRVGFPLISFRSRESSTDNHNHISLLKPDKRFKQAGEVWRTYG